MAGRRALFLALLVGGLFALGLLWGQRAQAADGVPTGPVGEVRASLGRVVEQVGNAPTPPQHSPLPVADVVEGVTEGLDETREKLPPLSSLPTLPTTPDAPGLPALPELPVRTLPAPATTAPQPEPEPGASSTGDHARRAEAAKGTPYGPRSSTSYDVTVDRAAARPHHRADSVTPPPAPVPHAPTDGPGGALDHRATVDNGTPRHGDAHAVALDHRAPLRLVPGAAARVDADETRDEYRDIPVSPA